MSTTRDRLVNGPMDASASEVRAEPARPAPRPKLLLALALLVVSALTLPLAFLLAEAARAGAGNVWSLIWRSLPATLLWNTVRLTLVVTSICAVVGTLAAYGVERTNLP